MPTLNWKPANKRQQEQYWCDDKALVARVTKATLADRNNEVTLVAEIIVTGETVMFHYETAGQEMTDCFIYHFEKQVTGLAAGQSAAEDIFKTRLYGQTLIDAGYKETY